MIKMLAKEFNLRNPKKKNFLALVHWFSLGQYIKNDSSYFIQSNF